MRKISYYVIAVVVAGVAIISSWVYLRYFKAVPQPYLYFTTERADMQESIRVRSEVVAQKEFELEFPFMGTVEAVYVKDGEMVTAGERLMKLETKDLAIQASQLAAVVAQRKADLSKLVAGATAQDIVVSESKLASAQVGLTEATASLIDKIKDAYTKSDDAVRAKSDQFFINPRSTTPALVSAIQSSAAVKSVLELQRAALENTLTVWSATLAGLSSTSDLVVAVQTTKQNTALVSDFLNTLSPVVNNLAANASLAQATIDAYRADLSSARSSMSLATAGLVAAEEKYNLAVANVSLYENELALTRAPARAEDILIAKARIQEAEGQLAAVEENIRRSTLLAPGAGKISKVHYEIGEVFRPGLSVLSMVTNGYKLQSDVSELDIAKIRETDGNKVNITLDAFPGQQFTGNVVSVDAKEVLKTEDKYYRVNIVFDAKGADIRSGMSADATILSGMKKGVLRLPGIAIYTDAKTKYVKVLAPGLTEAVSDASFTRVDVQTGISDGTYVEITSGLAEGQTVVVTAE